MLTDTRQPLPTSLLTDIAQGIAASEALCKAVARHDLETRRPVRLLATEEYEVWVIGWTPGQGVDFHDHGDSAGALVVTEGELVELRPDASGHGVVRSVLEVGDVHPLPIGLVHDVVNVSGRPATSVHVYSPPLTSMTRYDPLTFEPVRTDPVDPEVPALPAVVSGALLHPTARS